MTTQVDWPKAQSKLCCLTAIQYLSLQTLHLRLQVCSFRNLLIYWTREGNVQDLQCIWSEANKEIWMFRSFQSCLQLHTFNEHFKHCWYQQDVYAELPNFPTALFRITNPNIGFTHSLGSSPFSWLINVQHHLIDAFRNDRRQHGDQ